MAGALVTNAGLAKIAAFAAGGPIVNLTQFAVGDANGVPYDPNPALTGLVAEKWRGSIDSVGAVGAATFVITGTVPADTNDGSARPSNGFNVAELGIFDSAGTLFAIARLGNGYKPVPGSGQAEAITLQVKITVSNANAVTVTVDPASQIPIGREVRPYFIAVDGVLNAPPAMPALGATYVIGSAPTGAWAAHANKLAQWVGVWSLAIAPVGHLVCDNSKTYGQDGYYLRRTATDWTAQRTPIVQYGVNSGGSNAAALALGPQHIGCAIVLNAADSVIQQVTLPDHTGLPLGATVSLTRTTSGGQAVIHSFDGSTVIDSGAGVFSQISIRWGETVDLFWAGTIWIATGTYMARFTGTQVSPSWLKHSDGSYECWGGVSFSGATLSQVVTLPITMPTALDYVLLVDTGVGVYPAAAFPATLSTFTAFIGKYGIDQSIGAIGGARNGASAPINLVYRAWGR